MKRQRTEDSKNIINNRRIKINAGGNILETTLDVLTKPYPESVLALMFNESISNDDNDFVYFIDTDGKIFSYIIQYLRRNMDFNIVPFDVDKNLWKKEIDFWCLLKLTEQKEELEFIEKLSKIEEEYDNNKKFVYEILLSDKTNFMEQMNNGKKRIELLIPFNDEYILPNGGILSVFVLNIRGDTIKLGNKKCLEFWLINHEAKRKNSNEDYIFNGKKYNTYLNSSLRIHICIKDI